MSNKPAKPLSLLAPEATGGDTAEGGATFQEGVLMAKLPAWLARDGFTALIREAMADTEASFYVPGQGLMREAVEAKDHSLTPAPFWEEIDTFRRLDASSSNTFRWFTLACTGLSKELHPIVNGLRRVRDPYAFYDEGSGVREHSYDEYAERVCDLGHSEEEARFLFERVLIESDWSIAKANVKAMFQHELPRFLPEYGDCSATAMTRAFEGLTALVQSRKAQPVTRKELEAVLATAMPPGTPRPERPLRIYTATGDDGGPAEAIRFAWGRFFGSEASDVPTAGEWDAGVVGALNGVKDWVIEAKRPRRIRLMGSRRLSCSLAIGSVLSAVAGFAIEMEYRDAIWATDTHASGATEPYSLESELMSGQGTRLVVAIGICKEVLPGTRAFLEAAGRPDSPLLHLRSNQPVLGPDQANLTVRNLKDQIASALATTQAREIDLFFAGPAPLALFLGHRLNATAPVQCHEWKMVRGYVPSCRLFATG